MASEGNTYLFIYYYSTEGPKATYTVGKSTRSKKHMQHAINKTQGNRNKEIETKHYTQNHTL